MQLESIIEQIAGIIIATMASTGLNVFNVVRSDYTSAELDNRGNVRKFLIDNTPRLDLITGSSKWPTLQPGYNDLRVSVNGINGSGNFRVIFEWDTYQDFA